MFAGLSGVFVAILQAFTAFWFPTAVVLYTQAAPQVSLQATVSVAPVSVAPISVVPMSVPSLAITPESVIQGEPFLITIDGIASTSMVKKVVLSRVSRAAGVLAHVQISTLPVFIFESKVRALGAADLHQITGTYDVTATLNDGTILQQKIVILPRPQYVTTFTIPATLGGDTATSEAMLVSSLADESKILKSLPSAIGPLWTLPFIFPVANPIVTDVYGYDRQTGAYSIAHKGTDFRAPIGTPVYAANDGIVRLVYYFRDYGNTVVVDHGEGLMTLYMHLSKSNVAVDDVVKRGQVIALSGATGDALGPHLHLSVWIGKISIDPMKFLELMK